MYISVNFMCISIEYEFQRRQYVYELLIAYNHTYFHLICTSEGTYKSFISLYIICIVIVFEVDRHSMSFWGFKRKSIT